METHGHKKFVLTGSSARKVKRGAANLLAGRAIMKKMYSLTSKEINFSLPAEHILTYGMLPLSATAPNDRARQEFLEAYVLTYIHEEIKHESIVRQIGSFSRFMEIASLMAGQRVNISNISREAEISRDTARNYFSIFEDTLLGSWLPAYRPRAKIKEVGAPKFYWFDSGVLHAAAQGFKQPLPREWRGILFEHWLYHELISYLDYGQKKGSLSYWGTPGKSEIDFLWWYGDTFIAIEVKASEKFRPEYVNGIRSFSQGKKLRSSWIIYLGNKELRIGSTWVLPIFSFLKKLYAGEIIPN
jgi:predicted AAA+ superfamily ATPase